MCEKGEKTVKENKLERKFKKSNDKGIRKEKETE